MTGATVEGPEHPAVRAWATLHPELAMLTLHVETLQKRKKGVVYRLIRAGPSSADVVAKRASRDRITRESLAYEHVLPALSLGGVRYYGKLADRGGEGCWLFLSYAGEENYSPLAVRHRTLAARLLAALHTSSAAVPVTARLPDRGPGYYLRQLQHGREEILKHLSNPGLKRSDVQLLEAIVRQLEVLALRWSELERVCDLTPRAFVHGDFAPKNIRVAPDGAQLLAFDWASGGWGVPAADLPQTDANPSSYWANPDLDVYLACVAGSWPELRSRDLTVMAAVGKLLRTSVCIRLEAVGLATDWPEAAVRDMRYYHADMEDALRTLRWVP
jgi:Phosphotransferase enzyme family